MEANPIQDVTHFPDKPEDAVACPRCHGKISPNTNYCPHCNEEIILYCPRCEQLIERARGQTQHICNFDISNKRKSELLKATQEEIELNFKGKQHCPSCWKVVPITKENNCPNCKRHILTYDEIVAMDAEDRKK